MTGTASNGGARLGKSPLGLSRVGLGAWAIGGGGYRFGWGPQADDDSIRTMRAAVEAGVNWIDTAPVYGRGHSEEVIGRFLDGVPVADRPMVFTKCGIVWDRQDPTKSTRTLHPDSIRAECDDSLRRLRVECIDLLQFHQPDQVGTRVEDSWAALLGLVDAGKIRAAGVSNFEGDPLERCWAGGRLTSVQSQMSLIDRDVGATVVPWAAARGVGVLAYSPMASGLLTDSFDAGRVGTLPEDDWRSRDPRFQDPQLGRALRLRESLKAVAARHGTTVAAVAVAWVLAWPGVTAAIVGARRPEQVAAWAGAAALELTAEDLGDIETAVVDSGAGSGPVRPAPESGAGEVGDGHEGGGRA
ncbi:MAG: aldo/keto reductase [bacterium]|nr:aldo/keto reductase [bacterium]